MFTVLVKDFQSLSEVEIEVSGLTVITGQNNKGKSALIRSIFGAFTNPRGYKYVRRGTKHCSVSIDFNDGKTLTWEKGKHDNRYIFNGGKPLEKVGAGAPEELASFGVQPIRVNDEDVWPQFAPQFTGQVFMLDKSGSALAECIADVDRVGVLNEALRLTQSDHRTLVSERKVRQADILRLEAEEKSYDGLDSVLSQLADLETLDREISATEADITRLTEMNSRLSSLGETILKLSSVRGIELPMDTARAEKIAGAYEWAVEMAVKLKAANEMVAFQTQASSAVRKIALPTPPDLSKLTGELADLRSVRDKSRTLNNSVSTLREDLRSLEKQKSEADKELSDLMASLKTCPTCGTLTTGDDCQP